jgi:transposase
MLAWMRSLGDLQRIGVESTGSYGAGLLPFMQQARVAVLEVTTQDKQDRRRRGKNDDLDAQNAAHAALARQRTVTPRSHDGMIESLPLHGTLWGQRRIGRLSLPERLGSDFGQG